jgi:predicted AlkP superfamily pyrophosphatase or phosphodiesterase
MRLRLLPLVLALVAGAAARAGEPRPEQHVVMISIDALRPEFYRSDAWDTPTLKAFVASGASADGVEPAYPSVTYPGHASIVTGVRPNRHGITSNTVWGEKGAQPEWLWETSALQAKPIWRAAMEQGRNVAITQWPTTVGAKVTSLVPERWGLRGESTRDLLLKFSTPGLLFEIALDLGIAKIDSSTLVDGAKIDEFVSGAAAYVLKTRKPDLLLLHLTQVDHFAHGHGRDAPEVKAAVARVDRDIAKIVKAAKDAGILEHTVFVIVGDHGFTDVRETVAPNTLLVDAGLVVLDAKNEVESWRALGHAHGGSMAIYARTEEAAAAARAVLERNSVRDGKRLYRIVDRKELDALGADPKAAFFLDAAEEKALNGAVKGDLVRAHELNGTHGGLPTRPQLLTGFIASGPGVRHTVIAKMRLIDIAPTVSKLMGVDMRDMDGGVLDILTVEPD